MANDPQDERTSAFEDPGWGSPKDIALGMVLPQLAIRRSKGAPALQTTRTLFVSFTSGLVLIGFVVLLLTAGETPTGSPSATTACAAAALFAIVGVTVGRLMSRDLPCGSIGQLVGAYRTRFFLLMTFNEAGGLIGFVLVVLSRTPGPYFVALPIGLAGQWLAAPTQAHIEAEDRSLAARGCPGSLSEALFANASTGPAPAPSPTEPPSGPGAVTNEATEVTPDPPASPREEQPPPTGPYFRP